MSRLSELIAELCPYGVEYRALEEVAELVRGSGLQKKDFSETGVGCIHYGQIHTKFGAYTDVVLSYVPEELAKKLTVVHPGDVVVAATSEDVSACCKAVAWMGDVDVVTGGHCVVVRHDLDPKYLSYCFQTDSFYAQKKRFAAGVKVIEMRTDKLARIRIPVPPIEVQREVVRILDEYTAAYDELVRQLEQEIELRKQSDALSYQRYLDEWIGATSETMMLKELVLPGRKISYGIVQPGEGGTGDLGVIRPIDIKNSHINVGGIKYVDRSKEDGYQRTKLQGGEILVVVRGTTGEIAVAPDECKGMNVTRGIAVIATNDSVVDRGYLFDFLRGESAQRYIANNTRGTALRQINISDLEKLKIPVLRDSLREGFAEARSKAQTMTDAHYGLIHELSTGISLENQLLSQIRNQLLSFPEKVA